MVALVVVMVVVVLADDDGRGGRGDRARAAASATRCWRSSSLADLVALVLFSVSHAAGARRARHGRRRRRRSVLARLAWEIGGAVAFGVLVGALFALYLRYVGREVTLVLLGVCALLSQVGSHAAASSRCWRRWPPGW